MKKVIYKSHEYPSITALCNRFNVHYIGLVRWCKRHGIIDKSYGFALYRRTLECKQRLKEHREKRAENECITN